MYVGGVHWLVGKVILVTVTLNGAHPDEELKVKSGVKGDWMQTVFVMVSLPHPPVAINVTIYVPGVVKVWFGENNVDVFSPAEPGSPKFHK